MLGRQLGPTKLYNLVHNPAVIGEEIQRLREIHSEVDYATAQAYGWAIWILGTASVTRRQVRGSPSRQRCRSSCWTGRWSSTTSATPTKSAKACTPRKRPQPNAPGRPSNPVSSCSELPLVVVFDRSSRRQASA